MTSRWTICTIAAALALQSPLDAGQQDGEPATIEQRVAELERAAAEAAKKPTVRAGSDGFRLQSADGHFVFRLRGYVHFDARSYESDTPGTDTFALRRVRPILEATLWEKFEFRVMPDFGGSQTSLQDAYADVRFSPAFKLRLGKYKAPVGLERLQSATAISFVERSLPTLLVPNRDLGVQLHGDVAGGRASYAVMLSNGVPDGGSADSDTNDGKDLSARLFLTPWAKSDGALRQLGFGLAATTGEQEGSPTAGGLPSWRTSGQQSFFAYRASSVAADAAFADGDRTRLSPQAYYYNGPFGLLAEHVTSKQEVRRGAAVADLEHEAWQLAGSWAFGGKASYRGVVPEKPFDPEAGQWGAFELVARVAGLDLDEQTFPLYANPVTAVAGADQWTIGLNWYFNGNFKLNLNYDQTEFEGGATGGDRVTEKVILARAQISF
jgi:phosphate-selective porin OprO and OprP